MRDILRRHAQHTQQEHVCVAVLRDQRPQPARAAIRVKDSHRVSGTSVICCHALALPAIHTSTFLISLAGTKRCTPAATSAALTTCCVSSNALCATTGSPCSFKWTSTPQTSRAASTRLNPPASAFSDPSSACCPHFSVRHFPFESPRCARSFRRRSAAVAGFQEPGDNRVHLPQVLSIGAFYKARFTRFRHHFRAFLSSSPPLVFSIY